MSTTIECPSGLTLSIRGLKTKELQFLQDKQLLKSGGFLDRMLGACVEAVIEPGLYAVDGTGGLDWNRVLLGDKFFALLKIRSATFGDDFNFKVTCDGCAKKYEWKLKLSDLPVKKLAPEDAAAFKAGEPLATRMPSTSALVKFNLATGKDEKAAAVSKSEKNAMLAMLVLRIVEIDGVEGSVRRYLEEASLGDFFALNREFDKRDCGVDTDIETQCPDCDHVQEVSLPIGRNFWMPVQD